jgi:hypothetical protein
MDFSGIISSSRLDISGVQILISNSATKQHAAMTSMNVEKIHFSDATGQTTCMYVKE